MKLLKKELYFTKRERQSLLFLGIMALLFMAGMFAIYRLDQPKTFTFKELKEKEKIAENIVLNWKPKEKKRKSTEMQMTSTFTFNPNFISKDSLVMLGVSGKAADNLMKYRSKGGVIKSKEHFFKIYGMEKYRKRVEPLIQFSDTSKNRDEERSDVVGYTSNPIAKAKSNHDIPVIQIHYVDLNETDSFELQMFKGIGEKLSGRIIKYRDALGGFYSTSQLEEVYGLNAETYLALNHLLKADPHDVKKIDLNTANEEDLKRHPYINAKQAKILVRYRKQHGPFQGLEDFKRVKIFTESELEKLSWYLSFNIF